MLYLWYSLSLQGDNVPEVSSYRISLNGVPDVAVGADLRHSTFNGISFTQNHTVTVTSLTSQNISCFSIEEEISELIL